MKLSELCIEAAIRIDGHKNRRICSAVANVVDAANSHYTLTFILLARIEHFYPYVNDTSWPFPSQEERHEKVIALLFAAASFMSSETLYG